MFLGIRHPGEDGSGCRMVLSGVQIQHLWFLSPFSSTRTSYSEVEVRDYLWQILSAAEYLHAHGILHLDLRSENMIITEPNLLKLLDFGNAQFYTQDKVITMDKCSDYVETMGEWSSFAEPWHRLQSVASRETEQGSSWPQQAVPSVLPSSSSVSWWAWVAVTATPLAGHRGHNQRSRPTPPWQASTSPKLKAATLQPAVPAGLMFSRFRCSHDLGELPQLAPRTREVFIFHLCIVWYKSIEVKSKV